MSGYFQSRWVPAPERATEVDDGQLPQGFRAAGVAAGIKPSGAPDLGMIVADAPETVSAARFARTGTPGAPVTLTRNRAKLTAIRAVVVNSGNANA
ncbi:MAG: bifunctional ornithine acetyltransferase/N-acetylglutamate synthase, partial [Solirubrobacterales bacterium]|nr:bifunctional ornithine acetyltransferase/N-acetylglutamate synthase [Solirubrobacterales bacterium]